MKILSRGFIELLAATGFYMVTIKCVIREAEICSEICDQVRLLSSFFFRRCKILGTTIYMFPFLQTLA